MNHFIIELLTIIVTSKVFIIGFYGLKVVLKNFISLLNKVGNKTIKIKKEIIKNIKKK